ncbi:MAG: hypothetical protein FJ308_23465 [Planctomycetes bacterium]|nr:hypothetical protein [Planctomycetota bacterium]
MSRLQRLLKDRMGASASRCDTLHERSLTAPPRLGFSYRLFVPEHFEARYEYPLFVWLHSDNSSEYELDSIMEGMSVRNYVAIAPRAHRVSKISKRLFRWGTNLADLTMAEEFVFDSIDEALGSLPIHSDRIFLGGFGTAGTIAQWIGLRTPSRFAGVISINGPFPKTKRALAGWKQCRALPILFAQGSDSQQCSDDDVIETIQVAHSAGLDYRFVRFEAGQPGFGSMDSTGGALGASQTDSLDTEMLLAANRFMMGIVTSTEVPLVVSSEEPSRSVASAFGNN